MKPCLTETELEMIQSAYKLYGASDGFWINFNIITEAVTQRSDCSGKEVTDMVKSAFKELARTDSAFDEAF